jgi:hypothetical protein
MLIIFAIPLCALFSYLTFKLYRGKHYKQCLVMGALSLCLLLFMLGCLGLGYLWFTYPGVINL